MCLWLSLSMSFSLSIYLYLCISLSIYYLSIFFPLFLALVSLQGAVDNNKVCVYQLGGDCSLELYTANSSSRRTKIAYCVVQ